MEKNGGRKSRGTLPLKEVCHKISKRFLITKFEKFDSRCAGYCGVKILGSVKPLFVLQIFSFMIEVFTRKRIFPIVPLKATRNHRIFDFDSPCAVWLCGMMHTAESDSAVGCTPGSFLKFEYLSEIELENFRSWHTPFKYSRWLIHKLYNKCFLVV